MFDQVRRRGLACRGVDIERNRPYAAGGEIPEEVPALVGSGERAPSIDESPGDRLAGAAVVLEDRIDERLKGRRPRRHIGVRALAVSPAVVPPAPAARLVIDLFEPVLAD